MPQGELNQRLTINGRWLASIAELSEQQEMIAQIVPSWLTLFVAEGGRAIRLNGAVRFSEVLAALKAAR